MYSAVLREMDTQSGELCQSGFYLLLKRVYSKREKFTPLGSNYLLLEQIPIQNDSAGKHKSCLPLAENLEYQVPLK